MNERIKLLAEQADEYTEQTVHYYQGQFDGLTWESKIKQTRDTKFAELIVKKVLDEVAFRAFVSGDTAWSDDADRHWVELEFGFGRLAKLKKK